MSVQFTDNSAIVKAQMERNIGKALTMMGIKNIELATEEMQKLIYDTPESPGYKRTGHLRSGQDFQVDVANKKVVVGNNVEYAPYVHEGTIRTASRPFLKNSLLNYKEDYQEIAELVLGEGFTVTYPSM